MWPKALLGKTRFRSGFRVALRIETVLQTRILRVFFGKKPVLC
jgi:hypothetical protein